MILYHNETTFSRQRADDLTKDELHFVELSVGGGGGGIDVVARERREAAEVVCR